MGLLLKRVGFKVKIVTYKYPIPVGSPYSFVRKLLQETLGRILGVWKKYLDLTSAKLLHLVKE